MKLTKSSVLSLSIAVAFLSGCSTKDQIAKADHVFTNGYIYTADDKSSVVKSMAISEGKIIYLGSDEQLSTYISETTTQHDLGGKMMMPGLHDAHIHLLGIVEQDICDLEVAVKTLDEMVHFIQDCIKRYQLAEGEWLRVDLWNYIEGNRPSEKYPTLRVALDAASSNHPIVLLGNDGHHFAANSTALARAKTQEGEVIGLTKSTLENEFAAYKELVSVDASGEPSGGLTESAFALIESPGLLIIDKPNWLMPRIAQRLSESGITSAMDALLEPHYLRYFQQLENSGKMTFRLQAALKKSYDYPKIEERLKLENIPATVAWFAEVREQYASTKYIRADVAKILVDGVIEGDPYSMPPTLPNAASIHEYKQPIFSFDEESGLAELAGYVDLQGDVCKKVQEVPGNYETSSVIRDFISKHNHHPSQCFTNKGVFETDPELLKVYVLELDKRGFTVHAHAIGDGAVRVTVDAIENARKINGPNPIPHSIAHAQLVHPDDQKRIGELGIYMAFTHSWSGADTEYQMTVEPFIDLLASGDELFSMNNYYTANAYPTRSIQNLGGVITAGSDAPVEDRDPRPFVNIEMAITRSSDGIKNPIAFNSDEALDIHSILRAYTINGAKAMSQAGELGSLEVGKKADFIVIDQNIVKLAEEGKANQISETVVLSTWLDGRRVYSR